jgi:hypothetical protein
MPRLDLPSRTHRRRARDGDSVRLLHQDGDYADSLTAHTSAGQFGEHKELWGSHHRALEFNVDVIYRHPTTPYAL